MLKKLFRAAALVILCLLLVYAPELLASVRAPYGVQAGSRVLLRVALCTQDRDAASAFDRAVTSYIKENRAVHLRVTRVSPGALASLPEPHPDLVAFSPDESLSPEALLLPLRSEEGVSAPEIGIYDGMRYAAPLRDTPALLCAVTASAREDDAARALLASLTGLSTD